eukprot:1220190-Rhodomonas_salina.2
MLAGIGSELPDPDLPYSIRHLPTPALRSPVLIERVSGADLGVRYQQEYALGVPSAVPGTDLDYDPTLSAYDVCLRDALYWPTTCFYLCYQPMRAVLVCDARY